MVLDAGVGAYPPLFIGRFAHDVHRALMYVCLCHGVTSDNVQTGRRRVRRRIGMRPLPTDSARDHRRYWVR